MLVYTYFLLKYYTDSLCFGALCFCAPHRFISLLDALLPHLVPAWDYSLGTFNHIKVSPPCLHHPDHVRNGQKNMEFNDYLVRLSNPIH